MACGAVFAIRSSARNPAKNRLSTAANVNAAIRGGVAYVNIHALPLNGGDEIRGQIEATRGERD